MTSMDRFDTRLPQLLDELSQPRTPDWFDDFVGLTARTRQRPAWTLPERWLPMTEIARQPVLAPRLPLRSVAIGFLIIALVLAALFVVVAGSRRTPAPPFGLAKTGLVVFDRDGDIFVGDHERGTEQAILAGPEFDTKPVWSLDGTHIAFQRKGTSVAGMSKLFVAKPDGSDIVRVTPDALLISSVAFSPDGRRILVTTGEDISSRVYLAEADGSGIEPLPTSMLAGEPVWSAPDGREVLFFGTSEPGGNTATAFPGIYGFDVRTSNVRTVVPPELAKYRGLMSSSPDGKRIAYTEWVGAPALTAQTHVATVDGKEDMVLPLPAGAVWESGFAWSNDSSRLLIIRGYTGEYDQTRSVVAPADDSGTGTEVSYPTSINAACCSTWQWAPDDSFVLGTPTTLDGLAMQQVILDPRSGQIRAAPFATKAEPSIQRLAR
jgi:WD40 repeat protein